MLKFQNSNLFFEFFNFPFIQNLDILTFGYINFSNSKNWVILEFKLHRIKFQQKKKTNLIIHPKMTIGIDYSEFSKIEGTFADWCALRDNLCGTNINRNYLKKVEKRLTKIGEKKKTVYVLTVMDEDKEKQIGIVDLQGMAKFDNDIPDIVKRMSKINENEIKEKKKKEKEDKLQKLQENSQVQQETLQNISAFTQIPLLTLWNDTNPAQDPVLESETPNQVNLVPNLPNLQEQVQFNFNLPSTPQNLGLNLPTPENQVNFGFNLPPLSPLQAQNDESVELLKQGINDLKGKLQKSDEKATKEKKETDQKLETCKIATEILLKKKMKKKMRKMPRIEAFPYVEKPKMLQIQFEGYYLSKFSKADKDEEGEETRSWKIFSINGVKGGLADPSIQYSIQQWMLKNEVPLNYRIYECEEDFYLLKAWFLDYHALFCTDFKVSSMNELVSNADCLNHLIRCVKNINENFRDNEQRKKKAIDNDIAKFLIQNPAPTKKQRTK